MPKINPTRACSASVPSITSPSRSSNPAVCIANIPRQAHQAPSNGFFYDLSLSRACSIACNNSLPSQAALSQAYMRSRPLDTRASRYRYADNDPRTRVLFSDGKNGRDESDERLVKLGKTLRTLSAHLPSIFVHALPQEIISPNMTLHLFPSTHPRLPVIKGRMSCTAALWTAPVAWGSVPIVGNVRIVIISERMIKKTSSPDSTSRTSAGHNRLVVHWKTEGANDGTLPSERSGKGASQSTEGDSALSRSEAGTNRGLSALLGGDAPIFQLRKEEHFMGLFIFSFNDEGQIFDLKIEHAENNDNRERPTGMSSLTDWLLGKTGMGVNSSPSPAMSMAIRRKR